MGRAQLVVASNRGPVSFSLDESGNPVKAGPAGGLAAALEPLLQGTGASWVACAMSEADRKAAAAGLVKHDGIEVHSVQPDPATYKMAYDVISNSTLWFCHHHLFDLTRRPRLDRLWMQAWDAYRELNRSFAAAVCDVAAPGATVLVQDYHLCLLPRMLRAERDDLRCVHFTHTPFADPNMLRVLPSVAVTELLEGMAASAACGFHTKRWEAGFLACCGDFAVRTPRTFVSPLSPDPVHLARRAASAECLDAAERLSTLVEGKKVVLSVDRVEPSKNLLRGFWAFDEMLHENPALHSQVMMLSLCYRSRQGLPEYLAYATELEYTARRVNETWGTGEWTPVVLDVADDPARSFAALALYDVLLVNPVRDGLNLVAKEGPLLNKVDGVLALSHEAGAFAELGPAALELNPFDTASTAKTLAAALTMSEAERSSRAADLRDLVMSRDPRQWLDDQLEAATR